MVAEQLGVNTGKETGLPLLLPPAPELLPLSSLPQMCTASRCFKAQISQRAKTSTGKEREEGGTKVQKGKGDSCFLMMHFGNSKETV